MKLPSVIAPDDSALSNELLERVCREKSAYEDDRIDQAVRKWWGFFPHVFENTSVKSLNEHFFKELGDIRDKTVLEIGCGQGDFAAWLMDLGAHVVGIDISEFNVVRCEQKFREKFAVDDHYKFCVMDAHHLQFPDNYFDCILGNGILHHLDIAIAWKEVNRLLKPGGKALFQEPLNDNPILKLYRYLARFQTEDERPLSRSDIDYLQSRWHVRARFSGLVTLPVGIFTSVLLRPFPNN
jgi:ubiquinone/menaquinone biosynthesis C-methylase UbiE